MSRHTINNTLGPQNAQHRTTATGNLRPASILNNPGAETQAHCLRL